jgi:large subunit ribosomal protein L3
MKLQLIGKKIGMTQIYDEQNQLIPVTVVEAGPCPVTQVKTIESDGYNAVQIAFQEKKPKNITAALQGHFKKANVNPHATMSEFRTDSSPEYKVGDVITVAKFQKDQLVDVIATVKGRGFQGVMKRWNFGGGPASHGSMFHRRGGSYGCRQSPGEVQKGKKMPGHMGDVRRTVQNLKVIKIIEEKNLILVRGSFPGSNGSEVVISVAKKTKKNK